MQCVYIGCYFVLDCSNSNHCMVYLCFEGFSLPSSAFLLFQLKKNSFLEIPVLAFGKWFCFRACIGELLASRLVHSFSLLSFPLVFFSLSVSLFLSCPCCGLLLASSMVDSSCCCQNCSRNSVHRLVLVIGLYPL
jgi:hypothetical protein